MNLSHWHTCATVKVESQRTAGSKTPGKGAAAAGRTKLLLYYCIVGPTRHQGYRRTRGGIRRDTKRTGGHRDTTRTGGHSGGSGETPRGPEGTKGDRSRPQGRMDPKFSAII
jgi:hypothetical protein